MRPTRTMTSGRSIGPVGTIARAVVGVALLVGALADQSGLQVHEAVLGLVVFPAVTVGIGLWAARYAHGPLRFTGLGGMAVNCTIIVTLFVIPATAGAAVLFYGVSLLVGAARGLPHCEDTAISNLILGRDDQIGCPVFTPIDTMEARHRKSNLIKRRAGARVARRRIRLEPRGRVDVRSWPNG